MISILWSLALFLLAVVVHEYAHGWVAHRLGDPTAKQAERLTLNPLAHLDPIGTVLLPTALVLLHFPVVFGWAKPIPINVLALRNPRRDIIWVGLAGPIANILCALGLNIFLKLLRPPAGSITALVITGGILVNLVLACFNAVPIPPLDGSRVLFGLLPRHLALAYARLEPYGFLIVLLLLYLGLMNVLIWPLVTWLMKGMGVT